jgi:tetratricopeptide (TPR) repeat protein
MRTLLSSAALGLVLSGAALTAILPAPAAAQSEEEDRRRSRQTLQARTGQELNEALNFNNMEPPQTQQALNVVNQLLQRDLPPFDRATVLEIRGSLNFQAGNTAQALRDFVEVLNIDALPSDRQDQIRRNVAQLYFQEENYAQAARFMQEFIQRAGDQAKASDYYILAAAYYQQNQYRQARGPAETAIRVATERKKEYYDFLNSLYVELGLPAERGQLLETMVEYFPQEESYWAQLSGSYSEAGRERDAFATLEAAYRAGLVEDEPKLKALAQFYYALDNPYRGAQMLSKEMAAGNVKRTLDNLRLLSQLWAAAREQDEAIEILTEAAGQSSTGDLYYQLGQSYVADEQFNKAIEALNQALRKGGLGAREQGNAYLLIGNSYFSIDSETAAGRRRARDAYTSALRYPAAANQARQYIEYIDAIIATERAQDEVERLQAIERVERQIERCETILDIVDLGGSSGASEEQIAECRALLARVESGVTPEEIVRADRGAAPAPTPTEEAEAGAEAG